MPAIDTAYATNRPDCRHQCVTIPRRVIPGQTVMVQRRTMYRMFLLLPTSQTRQIIGYCLAYALSKTQIEIHEFTVLSNHYHLVLTDPLGELPVFMRELNSLTARALNASYGRWEAVWAAEPYCAPELLDGEDVLAKCIYCLANPTAAGMVRYAKDYEGLNSWHLEYGQTAVFRKPKDFFSDDMPETASLTLARPRNARPELNDRELRAEIRRAVREREHEIARKLRAEGGAFLGMKRVLRQRIDDTPSTRAPRRGIRPRVAGRSRWARVEALQRNQAWLAEYRACLDLYREGWIDVVFPYGTYQLRVEHGLACRAPP